MDTKKSLISSKNRKVKLTTALRTTVLESFRGGVDMTIIPALSNQMMAEEKLCNVYHLVSRVLEQKINGDIVEFGCYEGKTAILIQKLNEKYGGKKNLHVYDSFEGLPPKQSQDEPTPFSAGSCKTTKEQLVINFMYFDTKFPIIHQSWFSQLKSKDLPKTICFAHLDGDFYSSTIETLELVYPRLQKGAIVVIDDYCDQNKLDRWNLLPGVKKACDKFLKNKEEKVEVLLCGNFAQGYFIKQP